MAAGQAFFHLLASKNAILSDRDAAVARSRELRQTAVLTVQESQQAILRSRALLAECRILRGAIRAQRSAC